MKTEEKITILTTSCKAYEDILEIHEFLYEQHWSDCPFKRILVMDEVTQEANYLKKYDEVIITNKSGRQDHLRVTIALDKIKTPYVIMVAEDMLLNNKVQNEKIYEKLNSLESCKGGCIKLYPFRLGDHIYGETLYENDIIVFPENTPYRISYGPAIWDKEYLRKISSNFEGGGDFERYGTELSKKYEEKILGCKYAVYSHFNAIRRGKWELPPIQYLSYYGIYPDFNRHSLMSQKDVLKQAFLGYIYNINPSLILKLQNLLNLGKKY